MIVDINTCPMGYVDNRKGQWPDAMHRTIIIPEFTPISKLSEGAREFLVTLMTKNRIHHQNHNGIELFPIYMLREEFNPDVVTNLMENGINPRTRTVAELLTMSLPFLFAHIGGMHDLVVTHVDEVINNSGRFPGSIGLKTNYGDSSHSMATWDPNGRYNNFITEHILIAPK